jgi:DNA-directed RNA polymerase specialized sigma subunit
MSKFWNEEREAKLMSLVQSVEEVSQELLNEVAEVFETTTRSVGAKLRSLGFSVQKASEVKGSQWSEDAEAELRTLLENNAGKYTYAEIAAMFRNGAFSAKSIQGKVLSMELTGAVKKTEKPAAVRVYTPEEEATFVEMAQAGASIEDIAAALGKELNSVRGKALSLARSVENFQMPHQAESHAKEDVDAYDTLGKKIHDMTVAEIAAAIGKTERGVKTALTRRKLVVKDYDGAKKAAKAAEKRDAA